MRRFIKYPDMLVPPAGYARRALAALLLSLAPLLAIAAPAADAPAADGHGKCNPPGPPPWGAAPSGPPPFLTGLELTDDQQDKVFALLHAAAPAAREREKAVRRAHEQLRDLGRALQFDAAAAASAAQAAAKADSELMLMRVTNEQKIYLLLTNDQRKQVEQHEREHAAHRHGPPPP